jgi:hypothetical protein
MKAYLITTGILFALIAAAHVFEVIDRSRLFASDVIIVALCAALAVWGLRLARTRA